MSSRSLQESKRKLLQNSEPARARVRQLVSSGQWFRAEPDSDRFLAYSAKHIAMPTPTGAEAIIGPIVDLQNVTFLTLGSRVRRAVAYVEVNDARESKIGSGFLVSPRLFLTNQHVIADAQAARGAQLVFDKETNVAGVPGPTTTYLLDPSSLALFSLETELDYALVAIGARNSGTADIADLGYCALSDAGDKHVLGMNVNIIQHPRGWPKMLAIRNNLLTYRTEHSLLYETDTEEGSSGSPVFNDDWQLIALHHWAGPELAKQDVAGLKVPTSVNEGVRISAIYKDLKARLPTLSGAERALLEEALSLAGDATGTAVASGPQLSGPRASNRPENSGMTTEARITPVPTQSDNQLVFTIPVQVSVSIAGGMTTTSAPPAPVDRLLEAPKVLRSGAEALQLDADYGNRAGYDPEFVVGENLRLPTIGQALAGQLAPLHPDVPNAATGELKYEHFSLKLNKAKRIAFFTATNIDGETFLDVDRKTGLVSDSEGETWFKDPRISPSYFLDQTFYSGWSTYFDRGHLTRRTDPTWGTPKEAERANADTFHFTNCSPQHFRFNEAARYWQGLERYVLENGVLSSADTKKKHLCVFQGPIFTDAIDLWADDVQIPSSFFKIVVWKGAKLKAVGLVADQLPLLSETRKSLGAPKDLPSVNVYHWRVGFAQIEKRTGLDFGKKVRDADTIATPGQPQVGEEAGILIRRMEDIRL